MTRTSTVSVEPALRKRQPAPGIGNSATTTGRPRSSSGVVGRAVPRQQCRTRADDRAHRADARRDHRAVGQFADAHRQVDAVVHEVDVAIRQEQPDANVRKRHKEVGHHRQNVQPPELQRSRDDELPSGRDELADRFLFGDVDCLKDAPRSREIGDARIRQA